jgi:beta-glucosidase
LVEILSGKTNPSGKLPITIEKDFKDSPGFGYIPPGESLYTGWSDRKEQDHPVFDIPYKEGIFIGYRWYEKKSIEPLYPFGYGLSYSTFEYGDLKLSTVKFHENDVVTVRVTLKNTGKIIASEVVQLYVQDVECSVSRSVKELKAFRKVELAPGGSTIVTFRLDRNAFSFWNPATKGWFAEKGKFNILIGSSSKDIRLSGSLELM